jgi:hypothetical protein
MNTKYRNQLKRTFTKFVKDVIYILYWSNFETKCKRCMNMKKKFFKYTFIHSIYNNYDDEFKIEAIANIYGFSILYEELTSRKSKYIFQRSKDHV